MNKTLLSLFVLVAGSILFAVAPGIMMRRRREIQPENSVAAGQTERFTDKTELRDNEPTNKILLDEDETNRFNEFCPENRNDKLAAAIRRFLLNDKAYRNPNLTRDHTIAHLGTNRQLFVQVFAHCFGTSFPDYVNALRLKDAVVLLRQSDMSIEAVSEQTGFGSVRTFQRRFRKQYGMSPKDYRKTKQNGKRE